jgi:hypothetical protein
MLLIIVFHLIYLVVQFYDFIFHPYVQVHVLLRNIVCYGHSLKFVHQIFQGHYEVFQIASVAQKGLLLTIIINPIEE